MKMFHNTCKRQVRFISVRPTTVSSKAAQLLAAGSIRRLGRTLVLLIEGEIELQHHVQGYTSEGQ
jgi:hypothetical protein